MNCTATDYFSRVATLLAQTQVTDVAGTPVGLDEAAARTVELFMQTGSRERKIVLVGNGGSASIAGHMEMDLCNRARVPAMVFNDPPVLTALSNDYGYVYAFERLFTLHGSAGDCLVAISSSGRSENILRAVDAARKHDCAVVTFSGFEPDNPLRQRGDFNYFIQSTHYGEVEVAHHALGHYLTDCAVAIRQAVDAHSGDEQGPEAQKVHAKTNGRAHELSVQIARGAVQELVR